MRAESLPRTEQVEKIKCAWPNTRRWKELQQRLCSVVESLVVLVDNRFISELTDSACLTALMDALSLYPNNEKLVESACRAIVGLLADMESSVLWTARITLSEAVMGSLDGTLVRCTKSRGRRPLRSLCKGRWVQATCRWINPKSVALSECLPGKGRLTQERVRYHSTCRKFRREYGHCRKEGYSRVYRKFDA
jgi:hypothetical protein